MKYLSVFCYLFMAIFFSVYFYRSDPHTPWWVYVLIFLLGIPFEWMRNKRLIASMKRKQENLLEEEDPEFGEPILDKACMNHLRGAIADGGIGYRLQDALIFIPHKMNLAEVPMTIPFSEIDRIVDYKVWGLFDTGLKIISKSNEENKFVIDKTSRLYQDLIKLFKDRT